MQIDVTGPKETYFVVWTAHGLILKEILFGRGLWISLREQFFFFMINIICHQYFRYKYTISTSLYIHSVFY